MPALAAGELVDQLRDRFGQNRTGALTRRYLRPALVLVRLAPEAARSAVFRSTTFVVSHDGCTPNALGWHPLTRTMGASVAPR